MGLFQRTIVELKETYTFRRVIYSLVSSTLKMRYKKSLLGFAWSMLGPLLNYVVVGLVISNVAKFSANNYLLYLLLGSAVYSFMSASITVGCSSMIANEGYIKKIYLPKFIFPLNGTAMETVNFNLALITLIFMFLAWGKMQLSWSIIFLPVAIAIITLFAVGMGTLLSIMCVFFRDLLHVVPICLQAFFFITPIIYPIEAAPEALRRYLNWNPFYHYVELVRTPLYLNQFPSLREVVLTSTLAVLCFVVGLATLKLFDNKIIFKL